MFAPWKKTYDKHRQHTKKQRHKFSHKGLSSQRYGFSICHVWMQDLDHKGSWTPKMMLSNCGAGEDSWSPLDCKEIKPVNLKGNQPWIFIRMTDAEAETPILRPPDAKNWLIRKDPDVGKDWGQEEKAVTQDEIAGWHHRFDGHKFEKTLGDSKGQQSLACCSPLVTKIWTWLSW